MLVEGKDVTVIGIVKGFVRVTRHPGVYVRDDEEVNFTQWQGSLSLVNLAAGSPLEGIGEPPGAHPQAHAWPAGLRDKRADAECNEKCIH